MVQKEPDAASFQVGTETAETIATQRRVDIPVDDVLLPALLHVPAGAGGLIVLPHADSSTALSLRHRYAARTLQRQGLATLGLPLRAPAEGDAVTDPRLEPSAGVDLSGRLVAVLDRLVESIQAARRPVGLLGIHATAPTVLAAAAQRPQRIGAVATRGGRPDLAHEHLAHVNTPTLLLIGRADLRGLRTYRRTAARLTCTKELQVIPGATAHFDEAGAADAALRRAAQWFHQWLDPASPCTPMAAPRIRTARRPND